MNLQPRIDSLKQRHASLEAQIADEDQSGCAYPFLISVDWYGNPHTGQSRKNWCNKSLVRNGCKQTVTIICAGLQRGHRAGKIDLAS